MSFCTECGFKLPEGAAFCPNCGKKLPAVQETETDKNFISETIQEESISYESDGSEKAETSHTMPAHEHDFESNAKQGYSYYGYPSGNQSASPAPASEINSGKNSRTAIIVIISVVVLLVIATALISKYMGGRDVYIGYWESSEVDIGAGFEDDLFGYDAQGLLAIELNKDGSYRMISAFDKEPSTGSWNETRQGIRLKEDSGETHELQYRNGKLIFTENYVSFAFIPSKRSIDNPSVAPGKYSLENDLPDTPGINPIAGSGYVENEDFYISFIGAEAFTDIDGNDSIRIYYEFTNNSEYTQSAWLSLGWEATQDDKKLEYAYCWDDVDVYNNDLLYIRPEVTIQCCIQFNYDPKGGKVDLTFYGWDSEKEGGEVSCSYLPDSLPGSPAPYIIKAIEEPKWTLELESEGSFAEDSVYASVMSAEPLRDYSGSGAVRVYYEITNNSDENIDIEDVLEMVTYQDGIELEITYAEVDTQSDQDFYNTIAPGKTVNVSRVFLLRNQGSQVEAEVKEYLSHYAVGQTYKVS